MRCLSLLFLFVTNQILAQSTRYDSLWNDPAIEARIQQGIETNRKGDFTLTLTDKQGKPIRKVTVDIRQNKHAFLFGANSFMLNGFPTALENEKYESFFKSMFNLATIPFYWKTLEPEQGKPRYTADSKPIYRRPPTDVALDFCRKNGITPHGHTLVWDEALFGIPDWIPQDTSKMQPIIDKHIQELAQRYSETIKTWDVTNELLISRYKVPMPSDYASKAFRAAQAYFPKSTRLFINENTPFSWQGYRREFTPYYLLIENLKLKGARIDGIGMQFHLFEQPMFDNTVKGMAHTPTELFRAMDLLTSFGVPLHISEITIPTLPNNDTGLQLQAKMALNFYRIWFSHPAVEAIIYWNTVDGTAVAGEDKWNGGLLNRDFSPKPSFTSLNDLINKEWKTSFTTSVIDGKPITFRGFYGDYTVKVTIGKQTIEKTFKLAKDQPNTLQLKL